MSDRNQDLASKSSAPDPMLVIERIETCLKSNLSERDRVEQITGIVDDFRQEQENQRELNRITAEGIAHAHEGLRIAAAARQLRKLNKPKRDRIVVNI